MTEHILSMLGLALKAGRVEVGEEPLGYFPGLLHLCRSFLTYSPV